MNATQTKTEKGEAMTERQHLTVENEFRNPDEIKAAKNALAVLTGCPVELIDVYVQGHFKIANRSFWTNELNIDYGWYQVTKIGNKYLTIHVPSEGQHFKAEPDLKWGITASKPGFRLVAPVFNTLSFRY
jgi:hypothetical protein